MSFFSQILSNFQFHKPTPTKPSSGIVPKLNEIEPLTDTSSADEFSDISSEADVNTLQMVEIMTEFHQGGTEIKDHYKESLENGELHQKVSNLKGVAKQTFPLVGDIHHNSELNTAQHMVLETEPEKMVVNGNKICRKKYGITKRNRYLHENMWSKGRA